MTDENACNFKPKTDRWPLILAAVVVLFSFAFAALCLFLLLPRPVAPTASPVVVASPEGAAFRGGWVDDQAAREAVRQSLPVGQQYFGDTPAGKAIRADGDKDILLSDAVKIFLGEFLPSRDQKDVGSCVSFGVSAAIERLFCLQALEQNLGRDAHRDLVQEAIYGLSRVEIGGGKIRGDGSVTAWAAEAVRKYGVISRGVYGSLDLTKYDTARCREWGRLGLPNFLEEVAREHPVKGITFIRSAAEAAKAIRQGYPIAQGSSVGFGNNGPHVRDADGFLRRNGTWGHCMACVGVIGGKRPGFLNVNSWGPNWISGPTGGHDIPPGSFFVDWSTYDSMVREGDAIAFSDAVGFPSKDPWFLKSKPAIRRDDVAFAPDIAP